MNQPLLTVFTPTYNRAHTLGRLYKSLQAQTSKNFEWLIIDDGSTDNTVEIVKPWLNETQFVVRYVYKENGGLHTGYNAAIEMLRTELAVCIDSDDYMPGNAVELIEKCWITRGSSNYAGIVGLDYDTNGNMIGGLWSNQESINLIDMSLGKLGVKNGDKKNVVRTDLYKTVAPMKVFPGEKNFNPHWMHLEISRQYDFIPLNECLCIVDYQSDGMTASMFKQYYNSPNSFLEIRKQFFSFGSAPLSIELRNMVHLNSSALLAHRWISEFTISNRKLKMLICQPAGLALSIITRIKGR